jgi:hypothetical protein
MVGVILTNATNVPRKASPLLSTNSPLLDVFGYHIVLLKWADLASLAYKEASNPVPNGHEPVLPSSRLFSHLALKIPAPCVATH